ncbi:unnamed protein product [Ixodes pacificus]
MAGQLGRMFFRTLQKPSLIKVYRILRPGHTALFAYVAVC